MENCCNQQYSITAVTTSTGSIAERYAYTAYGQPTILDASASVLSSSAINNRYTYTGREWDATLGLHHFRARWMSPSAGRFLGRDPIGYEDGLNLSSCMISLSRMDPTGTLIFDQNPKPDPDDIKGPERKFLDGCECGLIKGKMPNPKEGEAWVSCDGKGGFKIRRQKDDEIKDFECMKNCGVLGCVAKHERHHIKQFKLRCPDACKGSCSFAPKPDDGTMGFQVGDCRTHAECYASRVQLNCINALQFNEEYMNRDCGGKTCREWHKIFFDRYENTYARYKCQNPMELPKWIDPSK
ncbi:MAG: RHS repeat-associated core domain-containing protein [Planctomycetota bacterium]|nr:RHS repeat-associated core domain-containing protein [Planctomycetota bacterium]